MQNSRTASLVFLPLIAGCASASAAAPPSAPSEKPGHSQSDSARKADGAPRCAPSPVFDEDTEEIAVIAPDRTVPPFSVTSTDCTPLLSDELIGKRPLVVVFFSSWCAVCDKKMPIVQRVLEEVSEGATFIGVALDEDETWPQVTAFLEQYGLTFPVVRGAHFRRFSLGYNPFQSVPVVVVVGADGLLVDLQIGYSPFDYNRLLGAVEVAGRPGDPQGGLRSSTATDNGTR